MIDQRSRNFEYTCRVSLAHEAQDTPGLASGQAKMEPNRNHYAVIVPANG